jgi:hypothetical protein
MRRLIYHIILYTSLFFISCNEHLKIEANDDPQGYADSQFVGTWKIVAVTSDIAWDWDNNGTSETNIFLVWSNCQRDNLYTFVGDKTGTFKLDCTTTKIGSWQVVATEYLVYTPLSLPPESEKITSMTSVQFTSALALTLSNGQPVTITKTWARQ